jgi:hypothetical protein
MSLKRITIIVAGGVAVAAWLSAAMTPGRAPVVTTDIRPAAIDATGAVLAREVARLRERLRPDAAPRQASRNPFVFRSSSPLRAASSFPGTVGNAGTVAPAATDASIDARVHRPRLTLSLAGVAEDPGAAGGAPVRTAIISGNGQLFLAKEGDTVMDRAPEDVEDVKYRVTTISADSAELINLRDNTIHRIALR